MKTTIGEFIRLLRESRDYVEPMAEARISLPAIAQHVAMDLFIEGDVTSPVAQVLRYQLGKLHSPGSFDFAEE